MAKNKTPKGDLMHKVLVLTMSDEEKAKKADLLAEMQLEKNSVKEEAKTIASGFAARVKKIEESINKLSREVKDGTEERNVECTMVKNYDANQIEYWYEDQLMEKREMTPEDRQMDLDESAPVADGPAIKKKAKGKKGNLQVVEEAKSEDEQIGDVIREETGRRTKRSSVDGVYNGSRNGEQQHTEI